MPRPPNSGGPQAPASQRFTVLLLLGETVLLVLNDPTLLSFGMEGALSPLWSSWAPILLFGSAGAALSESANT